MLTQKEALQQRLAERKRRSTMIRGQSAGPKQDETLNIEEPQSNNNQISIVSVHVPVVGRSSLGPATMVASAASPIKGNYST